MSFDKLIGRERLMKFSPVINLNTFRFNGIYTKNILKINIPCQDEDYLGDYCKSDTDDEVKKLKVKKINDESDDEGNDIEKGQLLNDVDERKNFWWRGNKIGQLYKEMEDKKNLISELIYQDPTYLDMIKTETKFIERTDPNYVPDILSLNRKHEGTIDYDSLSKYRNGFLNYVQSLDGNIEDAKHALISVDDFSFECLQKNPNFSKLSLFGQPLSNKSDKLTTSISSNRFVICREPNIKVSHLVKCKYYHFFEYCFQTRTYNREETIPEDFRITVRLLIPKISKLRRIPYNSNIWRPVIDRIYNLRGDNTLVELRKLIVCHWDLVCTKSADQTFPTKDDFLINQLSSSFIFIHDTIYIDKTRDKCNDITDVYIEFLKKRSHIFGPIKVVDMSNVKISDLNLRLGYPYVYVHMGGQCEHQFFFSDLRMLTANDYHHLETYPLKVSEVNRIKVCAVCKENGAKFIVVNCEKMPKCPKVLCYNCYHKFHYAMDVKSIQSTSYYYYEKSGYI
uniref:snRNA-activating protein complex subunit 3 n=1 Tax=Parastrongyloides trichosuri TaxID=131310 RepID=A0A0N4ZYW8_PARTI